MKVPQPLRPANSQAGWTASKWTLPAGASEHAVRGALCGLLLMGSTNVMTPQPALASDGAAIGKCLLQKCQLPLARCVTDPVCAANLLCIQACATNPATEADCQIKCGDEFSNQVVGDFTACAVSEKKCVPQRGDDGSWPVPKVEALVPEFKPDKFVGNWYISAGLNQAFDIFDCQVSPWRESCAWCRAGRSHAHMARHCLRLPFAVPPL